ncbi:hypothetical protein ACFQY5_28585 [Paeniroseomonas aquatica]|uniref:hypothetical protein n=1 Tax=Paeniroseomonas aquatica TaxID=373043 RepID=UPI00362125CB
MLNPEQAQQALHQFAGLDAQGLAAGGRLGRGLPGEARHRLPGAGQAQLGGLGGGGAGAGADHPDQGPVGGQQLGLGAGGILGPRGADDGAAVEAAGHLEQPVRREAQLRRAGQGQQAAGGTVQGQVAGGDGGNQPALPVDDLQRQAARAAGRAFHPFLQAQQTGGAVRHAVHRAGEAPSPDILGGGRGGLRQGDGGCGEEQGDVG